MYRFQFSPKRKASGGGPTRAGAGCRSGAGDDLVMSVGKLYDLVEQLFWAHVVRDRRKGGRTGPVDPDLLARMCEAIEHRGPDSRGPSLDGGVGLGIQRLAIIDLETGDQPISNEDGSVVVVLNGEIYNYRELREELERARAPLRHAQRHRGDRPPLRGATATAASSSCAACSPSRSGTARRRRLLLARDRVGKKPLFYSRRAAAPCGSPPSPRRSSGTPTSRARSTSTRSTRSCSYQYVPHPRARSPRCGSCRPRTRSRGRTGRPRDRAATGSSPTAPATLRGSERELHELIRERAARGDAAAPAQRRPARRLPLRRRRLERRRRRDGAGRRARRSRRSRSASTIAAFDETRVRARGRGALRHRAPRVHASSRTRSRCLPRLVWHYGEPFADSSAIPSFYLAELDPPPRHGRAQRRRRRRELRRLHPLRRPHVRSTACGWLPRPLVPRGRAAFGSHRAPGTDRAAVRIAAAHARPSALPLDPVGALRRCGSPYFTAARARARSTRPSSARLDARDDRTAPLVIARSVRELRRERPRSSGCSTSTSAPTCPATCS